MGESGLELQEEGRGVSRRENVTAGSVGMLGRIYLFKQQQHCQNISNGENDPIPPRPRSSTILLNDIRWTSYARPTADLLANCSMAQLSRLKTTILRW